MLSGALDGEKEEIILSEKEKLANAQNELDALYEKRRSGEISTAEFIAEQEDLSRVLENTEPFEKIYQKYLYIKENPGAEFFYDSGYERLCGISDRTFSLNGTLIMICLFALCFCSVYSFEYKSGAYKIIGTTKFGDKKLRRAKYSAMMCLSVLIFAVSYLPELIYIGKFYGFPALSAPIMSIPALKNFGAMPIWSFILIMYLLRFALSAALLPVISSISKRCKNNILTAFIFFALFGPAIILINLT